MKGKYSQKVSDYFDNCEKQIKKSYDVSKQYNHKFVTEDGGRHIIELIDKKEGSTPVIRAEYEIIGVYDMITSVWYWGWNIDFVDRGLVKTIESVKKIKSEIEKNYKGFEPIEADYLNFISSNGNFFTVNDRIQGLIKLALYECDAKWYIPIVHSDQLNPYVLSDEKNVVTGAKRVEFLLIKSLI
jgi:hypothetical protein